MMRVTSGLETSKNHSWWRWLTHCFSFSCVSSCCSFYWMNDCSSSSLSLVPLNEIFKKSLLKSVSWQQQHQEVKEEEYTHLRNQSWLHNHHQLVFRLLLLSLHTCNLFMLTFFICLSFSLSLSLSCLDDESVDVVPLPGQITRWTSTRLIVNLSFFLIHWDFFIANNAQSIFANFRFCQRSDWEKETRGMTFLV